MGDIMGMTDSQYKNFVEAVKEDLEELNEYKEAGDDFDFPVWMSIYSCNRLQFGV